MHNGNPLLAETERRLAHLRSLPLTELRKREILSLERVLAEAPKQAREAGRPRRAAQPRAYEQEQDDLEEIVDTTPRRRVERVEGRKKVILRVSRPSSENSDREAQEDERDRKERLKNTLSILGLTNRGMS